VAQEENVQLQGGKYPQRRPSSHRSSRKGKDPGWQEESQILAGFEYKLKWKVSDIIHVAIDTLMQAETWGRESSDKTILRGKYSLFDMDGTVSFDNIGKKVNIRFIPPLVDQLPKLKK